MVRTSRPLVERMTLVWHDWFATSLNGVGSQKLMLDQNKLLRRHSLGAFDTFLREITKDPAMLIWLSGTENTQVVAERELRARADGALHARRRARLHGAGRPRAGAGAHGLRQRLATRRRHGQLPLRARPPRRGHKRVFGKTGRFDWQDAVRLCLQHPKHASFFVDKLWSYFIPTTPDAGTRRSLERLYRNDFQIRPVVEAILRHPALYTGPRMVKPPAVYTAGMLRALGRGIDTNAWSWLSSGAGQRLFMPPNVSGWDDERWLDTASFRGRWEIANYATRPYSLTDKQAGSLPAEPKALVDGALAFWGDPSLRPATRAALLAFATRAMDDARANWQKTSYRVLTANALRQLIAVSPDLQTS